MSLHCRGIFFVVLLGMALPSQGQFFDSLRVQFRHRPKLDLRVETRNSFITSNLAKIAAYKIGLNFNGKVQVGLSYNRLFSNIMRTANIDINGIPSSELVRLDYQYLAPYIEYTFFRKGPWEASIPAMLGVGRSNYFVDVLGTRYRTSDTWVLSYEPFMVAQYHILRYFAVGLGVGYRLILAGGKGLNENFTSPVYILKGRLILGKVWSDIQQLGKKKVVQ